MLIPISSDLLYILNDVDAPLDRRIASRVISLPLRIFVSSVIRGFGGFRLAAAEGIRALNHEPVLAEQFPASPQSPRQACLIGVHRATALVLILGERYGAIQASGLSATHEEYREATDCSIPVLTFLQAGINPEPNQRAFISEVQDWSAGRLFAHFDEASALRSEVTRALHTWELEQASAPGDDEDILNRALTRIHEVHAAWVSEPTLVIAIAGGPTREILRPSTLEHPRFPEDIAKGALFGSYAVLEPTDGLNPNIVDSALILSQSQSQASLLIDQRGTIRITRAAFRRKHRHDSSVPSLIEEDVRDHIRRGLGFAEWLLGDIDPSQRLSRFAIAVAIEGQLNYLPWRTREELEASPNSVTMGLRHSNDPIRVNLNPPIRDRLAMTGQVADEIAEDLTVLLRRKVRV